MGGPIVLELGALPDVRVGGCGSLLVMVWRGMITAESLAKTNELEAALIAQHGRISVIGVITDLAAGVPSAELRQAAFAAMKRFQPHVRGTALVITSQGAKAVLARTFLAGLTLLIDFASPLKVFRSVSDATAWLWQLEGQDPDLLSAQLPQAVDAFVAQSRPASRAAGAER